MGKRVPRTPYVCGSLLVGLWLVAVPGWAGFEEGWRAYQSGEYATARREWLPLAQQGDAGAQNNLGRMQQLLAIAIAIAILFNTLLLMFIAWSLNTIAATVSEELAGRRQRAATLYRAWFQRIGQYRRDECSCSEEGPCGVHAGDWWRWQNGAMDAVEIGHEVAEALARVLRKGD